MEGTAVVKAVSSGDTVILQGRANNGPPPERQLSLASLLAPKVARSAQGPEEVRCVSSVCGVLIVDACWGEGLSPIPNSNPRLETQQPPPSFPVVYAQPFGWAAREYLRKLLVGHQVRFKVDYKVATLNNRVRLCVIVCFFVSVGAVVTLEVEGAGNVV